MWVDNYVISRDEFDCIEENFQKKVKISKLGFPKIKKKKKTIGKWNNEKKF